MAACPICRHPERATIEEALLAGKPYRPIAARYGVSLGLVSKHFRRHLAEKLAKAQEARAVKVKRQVPRSAPEEPAQDLEAASSVAVELYVSREVLSAESLLDRVLGLSQEAEEILRDARANGNPVLALSAIGRASELLKLQGATITMIEARRGGGGALNLKRLRTDELEGAVFRLIAAAYVHDPRAFLEGVREAAARDLIRGGLLTQEEALESLRRQETEEPGDSNVREFPTTRRALGPDSEPNPEPNGEPEGGE